MFLALSPLAVVIAMAVFVLLVLKWRYISLGSISAAAIMPLAVSLLGGNRVMLLVTALIALTVIVKHQENIKRLVAGTESRFKA